MTSYYMNIGTFEIAHNRDKGISAFGIWRGGATVSFAVSIRNVPRLLTFRTSKEARDMFELCTQDKADLWAVWPNGTECSLDEPRDFAQLCSQMSDDFTIKHAYGYDATSSPIFTKAALPNNYLDQFPDPSDIQQMRDEPSFTHRKD
jgi:hypothetical protein